MLSSGSIRLKIKSEVNTHNWKTSCRGSEAGKMCIDFPLSMSSNKETWFLDLTAALGPASPSGTHGAELSDQDEQENTSSHDRMENRYPFLSFLEKRSVPCS